MFLLYSLSLLSLLVPSISAIVIPRPTPTSPLERRAQVNPTPVAWGDPTNGWQNLPSTPNGGIHPTWGIEDADFVRIFLLLLTVMISRTDITLASVSVVRKDKEQDQTCCYRIAR